MLCGDMLAAQPFFLPCPVYLSLHLYLGNVFHNKLVSVRVSQSSVYCSSKLNELRE